MKGQADYLLIPRITCERERDTKESEDGGGGGLKRSFSSPNIAKMLEQEDGRLGGQSGQYGVVPVPKFDRFV